MPEWINDNLIWVTLFPVLSTFILGLLAKIIDRKKLLKITVPPAKGIAVVISVFFMKYFGKKTAEKIENGLMCTLCYVARETIKAFEKKLVEDNAK